jgi:hypothetical protein
MIPNAPGFCREAAFHTTSFSGGDRVELTWRKSSFSGSNGGDCVEVAQSPVMFGIRDSKNTDGPTLALSAGSGRSFLAAVKRRR